ncbi:hypothetical protein IC229_27530 [Spirosoma sp. BT702]|uniref:Uncharacterized protein n=1 Tax=Spirosoma profusum TaxID=2771354 RepID=A0A926Y0N1_9BACT|nr:hypothetical protein [Spirosoma profusum]MBD2704423.1 hypothetical protein [Spirosoma profusum]
MLNKLEAIAAQLGMAFGYGTNKDLDDVAQSLQSGFLLFHEGYFTADLNFDGQGALEYRHQLALDICTPSKVHDTPEQKKAHFDALDIEMRRVLNRLTKQGEVSGARARMGLNLTSRNFDAIQLTLTLKPNAVSICY